jgi:hypothetical protein
MDLDSAFSFIIPHVMRIAHMSDMSFDHSVQMYAHKKKLDTQSVFAFLGRFSQPVQKCDYLALSKKKKYALVLVYLTHISFG